MRDRRPGDAPDPVPPPPAAGPDTAGCPGPAPAGAVDGPPSDGFTAGRAVTAPREGSADRRVGPPALPADTVAGVTAAAGARRARRGRGGEAPAGPEPYPAGEADTALGKHPRTDREPATAPYPAGDEETAPGAYPGAGSGTAAAPGVGPDAGPRHTPPARGFLAKAAAVTAVLTALGALLGLVRDQILAGYFGAGAETDAFLVAWTVPEFASTLLIEDAMALILVPAFSRALAHRAADLAGDDPVRALVRGTLPRLTLTVAVVATALVVAAPLLVRVLAPGLPDPQLAVDCTRLTATCALSFALVGYCSAALRAHGRFVPPAAIYVAYNVGIIGTIVVLREPLGVRSAAAGVAVGGVLMVLVQAPSLLSVLRSGPGPLPPREPETAGPAGDGHLLVLGLIAPVVVFSLARQSQTLIERFLASPLPAGAISHLNYAQKVAQMPMILSLMLCTVSFPVVARALAAGDGEAARRRVERDLLLAAVVVLLGASTVIAAAPQIVELLFQRGEFDRGDTVATAAVMRVYALGLLGQTMVGALVRCYFSAARPLWYPAAAMGAGLAVTVAAGVPAAHLWGAVGIAGANALGITATAVLLLRGAHRQAVPVRAGLLGEGLLRLATAGAWATAAGWLCSMAIRPAALSVTVASLVVAGVFLLFLLCAPRAPEIPPLTRSAVRRIAHARRRAAPPAAEAAPVDETAAVGRDVPLRRRPR